jgi:hypothetical protein
METKQVEMAKFFDLLYLILKIYHLRYDEQRILVSDLKLLNFIRLPYTIPHKKLEATIAKTANPPMPFITESALFAVLA